MQFIVVLVIALVVVVVVVTWENKVNSYSDQLKLGQVCKFEVEFDKNLLYMNCKSLQPKLCKISIKFDL